MMHIASRLLHCCATIQRPAHNGPIIGDLRVELAALFTVTVMLFVSEFPYNWPALIGLAFLCEVVGLRFDIRANFRELERGLTDHARREVAKATADGITETLWDIKRNTDRRMRRVIDRPTPFTMRAFSVRRAWARNLRGYVFAKDIQAEYLRWLEIGGVQRPAKKAIPVPGKGARVNRYGNLPAKALAGAFANKKKFFSGTPQHGGARQSQPGMWQRMGRKGRSKLRLVALWADRANYTKKPLKFQDGARKTATARIEHNVLSRVIDRLYRK